MMSSDTPLKCDFWHLCPLWIVEVKLQIPSQHSCSSPFSPVSSDSSLLFLCSPHKLKECLLGNPDLSSACTSRWELPAVLESWGSVSSMAQEWSGSGKYWVCIYPCIGVKISVVIQFGLEHEAACQGKSMIWSGVQAQRLSFCKA